MNPHTSPEHSTIKLPAGGISPRVPEVSEVPEVPEAEAATQVQGDRAVMAASLPAAERRITVLPRVDFEGEAPKLVTDNRSRFEALGSLGEGGVGEVSLAQDNDIRRKVALKRIKPEVDDTSMLVRFVEEIRTVGQLEHPNIVPIHDVGIDEQGRYYYVMKYVDGETLEAVIEKLAAGDSEYQGRYTFARREEVFLGVLRAVQYAHAQGFIHRDIKPANIMVGRYGEVVVMDWGIARKLRSPEALPLGSPKTSLSGSLSGRSSEASDEGREALFRTTDGALIGTPAYMSPEQARGARDAVDERSDVFSLCVLFHEFLMGVHYLSDRESLASMLDGVIRVMPPLSHKAMAPGQGPVPTELLHFVRKGLAKDPSRRWRSVTAMIDGLMNLRAGDIPVQCPITFMKRGGTIYMHTIDRHPVLMMATLMLGAMVVLASAALALDLLLH